MKNDMRFKISIIITSFILLLALIVNASNAMGAKLDQTVLTGSLKVKGTTEKPITEYDITAGTRWLLNSGNRLYIRANANNNDGWNSMSLLGKFDFNKWLGRFIYPFAVVSPEFMTDYNNSDAFRFAWGGGLAGKLFYNKPISIQVDTGLTVTHEFDTGLPSVMIWWRSRARATIKISRVLYLHGDAVMSVPINNDLQKWYDYKGQLEFKATQDISIIGQIRYFDHRVFNTENSIDHQVLLRVKI